MNAPLTEKYLYKKLTLFHDSEMRTSKRKRCQSERLFRKSGTNIDRLTYRCCTKVYFFLCIRKSQKFSHCKLKKADKISKTISSIKNLFGSVKKQNLHPVFLGVDPAKMANGFFSELDENVSNIPVTGVETHSNKKTPH